jgi:hypothetical protein
MHHNLEASPGSHSSHSPLTVQEIVVRQIIQSTRTVNNKKVLVIDGAGVCSDNMAKKF